MQLTKEILVGVMRALRSGGKNSIDKRRQPRAGLRARAQVILPAGHEAEPVQVWVRDVSSGGVNLLLPCMVAAGSVFTLLLPDRAGQTQTVFCTVMHCRRVASGLFGVGATFNEIDAWIETKQPA